MRARTGHFSACVCACLRIIPVRCRVASSVAAEAATPRRRGMSLDDSRAPFPTERTASPVSGVSPHPTPARGGRFSRHRNKLRCPGELDKHLRFSREIRAILRAGTRSPMGSAAGAGGFAGGFRIDYGGQSKSRNSRNCAFEMKMAQSCCG